MPIHYGSRWKLLLLMPADERRPIAAYRSFCAAGPKSAYRRADPDVTL
jgi:hypothetical protein